MHIVRISITL
jgi:hypothetical protein